MPGIDYRLTAAQRRLFGGGPRIIGGRSGGKRYATEMFIVATAANEEEAKLALEDLRAKGIACLTDEGKRVECGRSGRRFAAIKFDEEEP